MDRNGQRRSKERQRDRHRPADTRQRNRTADVKQQHADYGDKQDVWHDVWSRHPDVNVHIGLPTGVSVQPVAGRSDTNAEIRSSVVIERVVVAVRGLLAITTKRMVAELLKKNATRNETPSLSKQK